MGINLVSLSGNLTRDVELKQTRNGSAVLSFGIAVNERVKNPQTGEWSDRPNFFDVVMYGKRAESLSKVLHKGMKVAIAGRLHYSSWENNQGQKRSKVEVIADEVELMQQRNAAQGQQQPPQSRQAQYHGNYTGNYQNATQNGYQQPQQGYQQQPDVYDNEIPW